jgi:hypothetical protein
MAALDLDSKTSLANECEPSHIVSLRGSLKPISSVKWKKDSWMSHLYGTILKPSHTNRFTDWWTFLLRDTLANHFPAQESEQEKKTQDISGLGSQMEFDFFNQECASLKMLKDTFRWDSPQSSAIWKNWVTKVRSEYSVRVKQAQSTKGKESSSWPTPQAQDTQRTPEAYAAAKEKRGGKMFLSLNIAAQQYGQAAPDNHNTHGSRQELSEQSQRNWQTFAPGTHNRGETPHRQVVKALVNGDKAKTQCLTVDQVFAEEIKGTNRQESWATPQASDHVEGARTELTSNQKCLGRDIKQWANPSAAKLNQRWVETLMGLPMGWTSPSCPASVIRNWPKFVSGWLKATTAQTNYDPAEMELFQQQQNERSES